VSDHSRAIIEKEVGKQIRLLRKARGISIQEAAESLGLSTNHYADLERGKYFPRVETLVEIVDFYNCTMDDLFKNVIRNGYEKDASEFMTMIRRMPPEKRKRIVEIIKLLIEE
jgi:transcriptional regulator with XRE-family HTH domain